jgi:hypothetical protein
MIRTVSDIADAHTLGKVHLQPFYKVWPSGFSTANAWWDATMAGNFPKASYYAGEDLVFTAYPTGNHLSFFHGGAVSPLQKILRTITLHGSAANLAPSRYILCDYLGFASGVSWETNDLQEIDNTAYSIPRYTDGKGVRAFIVQLFGNNANAVYTVNYRNCNNVDVTSQVQTGNGLSTGALQHGRVATMYNPFIDLNAGDCGIKRVNSITVSSVGAGIAVIVLVKPIAEIIFRDITCPTEVDYLTQKYETPIIYDGACLNFLMTSVGSPATLLTRGYMEFIWT